MPRYDELPGGGLVAITLDNDGQPRDVPLANFSARIVRVVVVDDGSGDAPKKMLDIDVTVGGRVYPVRGLPVEEFDDLGWVHHATDCRGWIEPRRGCKEQVRHAIQVLSRYPTVTHHSHLGWLRANGRWRYLHAGGAIGADGAVQGLTVALPDQFGLFVLPDPPVNDELSVAVRAALGLLDVAPARISAPLLCSAVRAPLGHSPFSVHLTGTTGVRKSSVAALPQQFFGAGLDHDHCPASWNSTANALERLRHSAKDSLFLIDDLTQTSTKPWEVDSVFRSQANGRSRDRMNRDTTLHSSLQPRGSLLSTGEDLKALQSVVARVLVVRVGRADVTVEALNRQQPAAARGLYAAATAAYVKWLASRLDAIREAKPQRVRQLRDQAHRNGDHTRTAGIVTELYYGAEVFLRFALESGAITRSEAGDFAARIEAGLFAQADAQAAEHRAVDTVARFFELLNAALVMGKAHVAARNGTSPPPNSAAWGWRGHEAHGPLIGWIDGTDLYLEPEATYQVLQSAAGTSGDKLDATPRTLWQRLHEREMLVSTDTERETLKVRRTVSNKRQEVIHLHAAAVLGTDATDDSNTTSDTVRPAVGRV